jgi:hypothetical protein
MVPPPTANRNDPHSKRLMVDTAEWRARLERLVEMRVHLDEDAALPPAPAFVPQGSP